MGRVKGGMTNTSCDDFTKCTSCFISVCLHCP
jgi:hypothetical protein